MGTEIACRAPAQLLLIECIRRMDGLYYHTAYEGKHKVVEVGVEHILNSDHVEEMRKAPIMFVSWCKQP